MLDGEPSFDLRLGDCLDLVTGLASLADKSCDNVICDPPYSEHVHTRSRRGSVAGYHEPMNPGGGGAISRSREFGFEHLSDEVRDGAAREIGRLVRRWAIVFTDAESAHLWRASLTEHGLEYLRTGAWIKVGGAPQFTGDRPAVGHEELIIAHPAGRKHWNGGGKNAIYRVPIVLNDNGGEARVHTAQKPVDLLSALVRDFTDPGDLILDPFAGSGTTGVAAVRLGRRFIGWERDPKYHTIATKRLAATREQLGLFAEGA